MTTAVGSSRAASKAKAAPGDPFLSHLVAVLSLLEVGAPSSPIPRYDGPMDWQAESILRSLGVVGRRMGEAQEKIKTMKAAESDGWQAGNPKTKRRRSIDDEEIETISSESHRSSPFISRQASPTQDRCSTSAYSPSPTSSDSDHASNNTTGTSNTDLDMSDSTSDRDEKPGSGPQTVCGSARTPSPMAISLDGIKSSIDPNKFFERDLTDAARTTSAPTTSCADHIVCPTCGRAVTDTYAMNQQVFQGSPEGSPLVVPPGPLATAAFESGLSAVEELKLLKTQVQDVSRVCQAVARGDLSQKITVHVQGVVMVQLKDVINTMVCMIPSLA